MQQSGEASQLQLLFIELRVGLARSAIQSALLLNGGAAVALLLLMANILGSASQRPARGYPAAEMGLRGVRHRLVSRRHDLRHRLAQGAIASGQSSKFGNALRRLGLGLIVGSLVLFLIGLGLVAVAI